MSDKKVIMACSHCGSCDVKADSYSEWHVEQQEWVTVSTFDKGNVCEVCDGETRLNEIPVDQWTGDACVKEELPSGHWVAAKLLATGKYLGIAHEKDGTTLMMVDVDRWGDEISTPTGAKDAARSWLMNEGHF